VMSQFRITPMSLRIQATIKIFDPLNMYNPAHPGKILKELVIEPLKLTITDVSEHLNVRRKTLSKVLNGRGAIALKWRCA